MTAERQREKGDEKVRELKKLWGEWGKHDRAKLPIAVEGGRILNAVEEEKDNKAAVKCYKQVGMNPATASNWRKVARYWEQILDKWQDAGEDPKMKTFTEALVLARQFSPPDGRKDNQGKVTQASASKKVTDIQAIPDKVLDKVNSEAKRKAAVKLLGNKPSIPAVLRAREMLAELDAPRKESPEPLEGEEVEEEKVEITLTLNAWINPDLLPGFIEGSITMDGVIDLYQAHPTVSKVVGTLSNCDPSDIVAVQPLEKIEQAHQKSE
jgi:hypothetical protein